MFRLVSHLRPGASASTSRFRPRSTVPHLRPVAWAATACRLRRSSAVYAVTHSNFPLNTSQYGVRYLSSLRPAESGSNHGGKTDGGENFANWLMPFMAKHAVGYFFAKLAGGVLTGLFCLDSGYAWYHNWKRERCIDAVLEASYGDSDSGDKKKNFVDRPDAERLFGRIIVSDPGTYSVIVGSCGTGKSALAKEVARKTPGVIYVDVPPEKGDSKEVEGGLDSTLSVALNWREPVTPWRTVLLSKIVNVPLGSPKTGFLRKMSDFQLAAARYKARHQGSCAVLIIDNVDLIAKSHPGLLRMLQGMAKMAADENLYKVIFVAPDGVAPEAMKGNSAWSRAEEHRFGDLTDNEARNYLEKRKVSCDTERVIRECGTRILTLQTLCNDILQGAKLDEVIERYKRSELDRFQKAASKVASGIARRVALAVIKAGGVTWGRYVELCGDQRTADLLLKENIFAQDVAFMVGFENTILESAMKQYIGAAKIIK